MRSRSPSDTRVCSRTTSFADTHFITGRRPVRAGGRRSRPFRSLPTRNAPCARRSFRLHPSPSRLSAWAPHPGSYTLGRTRRALRFPEIWSGLRLLHSQAGLQAWRRIQLNLPWRIHSSRFRCAVRDFAEGNLVYWPCAMSRIIQAHPCERRHDGWRIAHGPADLPGARRHRRLRFDRPARMTSRRQALSSAPGFIRSCWEDL